MALLFIASKEIKDLLSFIPLSLGNPPKEGPSGTQVQIPDCARLGILSITPSSEV